MDDPQIKGKTGAVDGAAQPRSRTAVRGRKFFLWREVCSCLPGDAPLWRGRGRWGSSSLSAAGLRQRHLCCALSLRVWCTGARGHPR